ncbi:MAG TPA: NosD domain-containing protein, partial [Gemmataceae bacterium]|nr:NosD domain-containing protein [Gemmataceae bacterium]
MLPSVLRALSRRRPAARRAARPTFRPRLEGLEDRLAPAVLTVTNANDSGPGSLRQAILDSNATPGVTNTIDFSIAGSGVHTINLQSALPALTVPALLDGISQPGSKGAPLIALNGAAAGINNVNGLTLTAGGSLVRGLDVENFSGSGILAADGGGDVIVNDYVGTDPTGVKAAPNAFGVVVTGGSADQISGDVVSGNLYYGIVLSDTAADVVDNDLVGVSATQGAGVGNGAAGVVLEGNSYGNVLGGDVVGDNGAFGLLLVGFRVRSNTVYADDVGLNQAGAAQPNGFAGVGLLAGATGNGIGGPTTAFRNVISGNAAYGVYVAGALTTGNIIESDYIGTNAAGTAALGNGVAGVDVQDGASTNLIALDVISGNNFNDVVLQGAGTSGNVVGSCFIGTDATGANGFFTDNDGVLVELGASGNVIANDVLSALNNAVEITGAGTNGNVVEGCLAGINQAGAAVGARAGVFIHDGPSGNTVGGTPAALRNVLSANTYGVLLSGAGTGNLVLGNLIGTSPDGTAAVGNTVGVELLAASGDTVAGNVIAGNLSDGVDVFSGSSGNLIQGNRVGTADGKTARGNRGVGLLLAGGAANNTVGGTAAAARNVISGNVAAGIVLVSGGTSGNLIEGNYIGVGADGATPLGNGNEGVIELAGAANNTVGGTAAGAGNVIAYNRLDGVLVGGTPGASGGNLAGTGNAVLGNSIFGNLRFGLDLGPDDGVTPNDSLGHAGPNNYQNFPVLTSALPAGGNVLVQGTLHSTPNTTFRIELFASPAADPSNHGQAQTFLGFVTAVTDSNGNATFATVLPDAGAAPGQVLTATATDPGGNTSEFSQDFIIPNAPLVTHLAGVTPQQFSTLPSNGDVNPYGIAFVPQGFPTTGTLQPGDILVANFNNNENLQGTGTTITRVNAAGQTSTFFTGTSKGLDAGLVVLKAGFVVVANVPTADGTSATVGQGSLQILDANGKVVSTLTDAALLNGPWDMAVNDQGGTAQLFV